jgi:hypothetical protein
MSNVNPGKGGWSPGQASQQQRSNVANTRAAWNAEKEAEAKRNLPGKSLTEEEIESLPWPTTTMIDTINRKEINRAYDLYILNNPSIDPKTSGEKGITIGQFRELAKYWTEMDFLPMGTEEPSSWNQCALCFSKKYVCILRYDTPSVYHEQTFKNEELSEHLKDHPRLLRLYKRWWIIPLCPRCKSWVLFHPRECGCSGENCKLPLSTYWNEEDFKYFDDWAKEHCRSAFNYDFSERTTSIP